MDRQFISSNDNILFSEMDSCDKALYMNELNDYVIEYRNSLGLNNSVTFGTEIEYEGVNKEIVDKIIDENFTSFKSMTEPNIHVGGEVVSIPLRDNINNWTDLKDILKLLELSDGIIKDNKTSSHVHVGANILRNYDNLIKFILLYGVYEGIIYRFGYMNRLNPRESMISCAPPFSIDLANNYPDIINNKSVKNIKLMFDRFHGVNFNNLSSLKNYGYRNTIEFRMANGTLDPVLWQNIINLYTKMLLRCTKDMDIDYLEYLLFKINYSRSNYYGFDNLSLTNAFDFADIVFDDMLDKTNFIKQYYKDGSETTSSFNPRIVKNLTRY